MEERERVEQCVSSEPKHEILQMDVALLHSVSVDEGESRTL